MRRLLVLGFALLLACSGGAGGGDRELGKGFVRFDSDDIAKRAIPVLEQRLKGAGVRGRSVVLEGDGRVRVTMDPRDLALAVPLTTKQFDLELCEVVTELPVGTLAGRSDKVVEEELRASGKLSELQRYIAAWEGEERTDALIVTRSATVTREHVGDASVGANDFGEPHVEVRLTKEGAQAFEAMTTRSVGRRIAIIVDGELMSAPVVQEPIPGGKLWITLPPASSAGTADRLAAALSVPKLPYKPVYESSGIAGPP